MLKYNNGINHNISFGDFIAKIQKFQGVIRKLPGKIRFLLTLKKILHSCLGFSEKGTDVLK